MKYDAWLPLEGKAFNIASTKFQKDCLLRQSFFIESGKYEIQIYYMGLERNAL